MSMSETHAGTTRAGQIGVAVHERRVPETLAVIRRADELGVAAAWLITAGTGPDGLTTLAVAAAQTDRILLGTAITPTFPRHPIVAAQQALVVGQIAPGRFRLGLGPSHQPTIESVFGIPFEKPLEHLTEYTTIVRQALQGSGKIDFDGKRFHVHGQVANPPDIPVLISALRAGSYELAGAVADGAISWITPAPFLRDVARPALEAGQAKRTDGGRPILVGQVWAVVSEDATEVLSTARGRLGVYARLPFYQEMFAAAGLPEARQGAMTDSMLSAIVIHGNEATVRDGIEKFLAHGLDEIIVSLLPLDSDRAGTTERTLRALTP
jgi:alkanesulfonate monooxygenase SsuD/methylene tetrahydromethanopterin reductase-like flavin-dependent oxidoreductase (luciferase family)